MEFSVKPIKFFGRPCGIICQNENGPCPLIAMANILLLENKISLHPDRGIVSLEELTQLVADVILQKLGSSTRLEDVTLLASVLNILPKLAHGLDLNVQFCGVDKFEFTEEISVFDALGIRLLHGWMYSPDDTQLANIVGNMSYNHIQFRLVEYKSLSTKRTDADAADLKPVESNINIYPSEGEKGEEKKEEEKEEREEEREEEKKEESSKSHEDIARLCFEGRVLEKFLQDSASQFTYPGMLALYNTVQDRQFAVFFRNNHFSTMYFYNGQLFTLATDLGYRHESSVVWEVLNSIDGNGEFFNEEFVPLSSLTPPISPTYPDPYDSDLNTRMAYAGGGTVASPPAAGSSYGTTARPPVTAAAAASANTTATATTTVPDTPIACSFPTNVGNDGILSNTVGNNATEQSSQVVAVDIDACASGTTVDGFEMVEKTHFDERSASSASGFDTTSAGTVHSPLSAEQQPLENQPGRPAEEQHGSVGGAGDVGGDDGDEVVTATVSEPMEIERQYPAVSITQSSTQPLPPQHQHQSSEIDADLLLALQLQEQEDALSGTRPAHGAVHSSFDVDQEEADRLHAIRLYNQDLREQRAGQHRQQQARPAAGRQYASSAGNTTPYDQSTQRRRAQSDGTNKSSGCTIC